MLDTPSRDADEELANHVAYVHMHNKHPDSGDTAVVFSPNEVRQYIAKARTYRPIVPKQVSDYMVGAYVRMRRQQKRDEGSKRQFSHVTPRTLLGIVRLSQALARLRFSDLVVPEDVDEALRLVEVSKASLSNDGQTGADHSPSSKIYNLIRGMRESGAAAAGDGQEGELSMRKVRERVLAKGFTEDQLTQTIDEYAELDVSYSEMHRHLLSLTNDEYRSGKLPATVHVFCSLRLVTMRMRTWTCRHFDFFFPKLSALVLSFRLST
jgi:DNA replication licensing factor MCM7